MKHLIAILILAFCWMPGAYARMSVSAPPVFSFCPFGDVGNGSNPDGCGQAPQPGLTPGVSGQVWHTDCFAVGGFINQYAGTSSNYTTSGHRPSENVPGCDYPVGSTIADANLLDPQTHTPAGCTYNATGGLSGTNGVLTCGGSSWTGLNGLMMGPIGTHGCTALVLNNSGAGASPVVISNSHWTNDGNCVANSVQVAMINGPSTAYPIVYTHLTIDGATQQFLQPQGTCATLACSAGQGIALKGDSIIGQYNVVVNFGSKPIIYNNSNLAAPFIWQYNFGAGWMMFGNVGDHAEFATDQDTIGSSERLVDHNVIIQATLNNGAAFAPWAQGLTGGFTVNGPFEFDSNVVVGAFTGGMPSNVTSMTGVIGCGDPPTCSVDGSKFYVTSVTGGGGVVGTGPTFTCAGVFGELSPVNAGGAATSAGIGGAYIGGAGSWFGMNLGGSTGHSFTGFVDDGTGGGSPSGHAGNILTITSSPIINVAIGDTISGTGIGGSTSITAMSPTSPYTGTGQLGTYAVNGLAITTSSETIGFTTNIFEGTWTMPPTTCTSTTLFTQSSPVGFLEAHNANIQGASEVKKNFIDISSDGSVPSFTMDNPGASCTSPTVFGGNVNMTTGNLDTLMNQWTTPGTGC